MQNSSLLENFERGELTLATFRHREHLRLAYLHVTRAPFEEAHAQLRASLLGLLARLGAPASHYHATLTRAWLLAVHHFVRRVGIQENSESFLARCPCLLDQGMMLTHYSSERLFSAAARQAFVEPDLDPIPHCA